MESVWDYPRPPRLEANTKHLVARFADRADECTVAGPFKGEPDSWGW